MDCARRTLPRDPALRLCLRARYRPLHQDVGARGRDPLSDHLATGLRLTARYRGVPRVRAPSRRASGLAVARIAMLQEDLSAQAVESVAMLLAHQADIPSMRRERVDILLCESH